MALRDLLPALATLLDAKPPLRVPAWLARPLAGQVGVAVMTQQRGAANDKIALRDDLRLFPDPGDLAHVVVSWWSSLVACGHAHSRRASLRMPVWSRTDGRWVPALR